MTKRAERKAVKTVLQRLPIMTDSGLEGVVMNTPDPQIKAEAQKLFGKAAVRGCGPTTEARCRRTEKAARLWAEYKDAQQQTSAVTPVRRLCAA